MRPGGLYNTDPKNEDIRSVLALVGLSEGPITHRLCGRYVSSGGPPSGNTTDRGADGKMSSTI